MILKRILTAALLGLLAACQTPAPQAVLDTPLPELQSLYREQAQNGRVYDVSAAESWVHIHVFRGGKAAKLGHNHVLSVPKFEGYLALPTEQAEDANFELRVPLAQLDVDESALRASTGGSFSAARSPADIEGTRRNMLGERGFNAERFPLVRLRSVAIEGDWPVLIAQVEVTLHGVARVQPILLHVQRDATQIKVRGEFILRQSDFGMTPFSALGGLMTVQDAVAIDFELLAKPANF
jgi:polyisoprenoid-binding protein YceI